jgi:hypothetical protein
MFVFQSTQDLVDERLVLHHEQVGIENSGILRADSVGDLLLHFENLRARLNERVSKRAFHRDMRRLDAITHNVIALDREDMNRATRDSRGGGDALATLFLVATIAAHSGAGLSGASTILR